MNDETYKEVYGHILNDAQRIRKEVMNEWGDIIMFGGSMPKDVMDELSIAARITGLAFDALAGHGVSCVQVNGKPDLYMLSVREENYVCHKSAIPSMSGFLDVVNIPGVSGEQEKTAEETSLKEKTGTYKGSETEEEKDYGRQEETEGPETYKTETEETEDETSGNEEPSEVEEYADADTGEEDPEGESAEDIEEDPKEDEGETEEEENENENDGSGRTPSVTSFTRSDIFTEETRKNINEFVYETFDASLTHSGFSGGGRPMDARIMIAPLKIQRFACPSVPILAAVFCNGRTYTASSYDQAEDGKNLVVMNIDEFYLLFRGTFDANGKFRGYVTTTGISASQGDVLNITSEKRYGDAADPKAVRNGHIKFRTTVYDAQGTLEAFPFGDPEDNEFIIMTKTDEFTDYIIIAENAGLKKGIIFQDNKKMQVDCVLDGEEMYVSLKEV